MSKNTNPSGSRLDRIDTFVIAGVVTVFGTRAYLAMTGYPQIGNSSLHIAHVLFGGMFLVVAFLLLLLSERPNKLLAALLGGIGFGLFIDEIGKFVTQDSNYFYEPAVGIMYIAFLLIWFTSRLIIVRIEGAPFLSPAEWPDRTWMRNLILLWSGVQAVVLGCVFGISLVVGIGHVSEFLDISAAGILLAGIYSIFLAVGLARTTQHESIKSAHTLRGATLFAIVAVYPFVYLNYPLEATGSFIATLLVVIGLSEVSVISLARKLLIRH